MTHDSSPPSKGRIEQRSTSPHRAPGAYYRNNQLEGQCIFIGKIDDLYPSLPCARVSLYGLHTSLIAVLPGDDQGNYFGARSVGGPSVGTEVLVYVGLDRKLGFVLRYLPTLSPDQFSQPAGQMVVEGGVNAYSELEAFFHGDWQMGKKMPKMGGGMAVDGLPGDQGTMNDLGSFIGVLRAVAMFRGSELAKIEAFPFDDSLSVVGHNLSTFTSQGEQRVFSDCGRISSEEQFALTVAESLGSTAEKIDAFVDNPQASLRQTPDECAIKEGVPAQVGKWRWKKWVGWLGDFAQSFLCRPAAGAGSLDAASIPDMGLYQDALTLAGEHLERSVIGGGIHKSLQVAVPKKVHDYDDPEGDQIVDPPPAKKPFSFDEDHPMGMSAQSRDYYAYLFNTFLPSNRTSLTKDWQVPDEASCPAPGGDPAVPGIGDFFRNFPPTEEVMAPKDGIPDDTAIASSKFRVGEAFMGILPDGSALIRDAWGGQIELRAGHAIITVSNDVNVIAGGSVVNLAGDDFIAKARQSMDLSTTNGQVRIKGERDVLVTSSKAGVVICTPTEAGMATDQQGEKFQSSGIILKSASGVVLAGDEIDFMASNAVRIKDRPDQAGLFPQFLVHCSQHLEKIENSIVAFKMGGDYVALESGNILVTQNLFADGSLVVGGSVVYGGASGKGNVDKLKPLVIPDALFVSTVYTDGQIKPLAFTFRSTQEYATASGQWYEASWQGTTVGLDSWKETAIQGTYPWPGADVYNGEGLYSYSEVNVEQSGKPKKRSEQSDQPGEFKGQSFNSFKVHPQR